MHYKSGTLLCVRSVSLTILFVILFVSQIGQAQISATVNRNHVRVGEQVTMTVTVQGSAEGDPELPDLSPFGIDVYSRGRSTNMRIVNGQVTSHTSFNYVLVPTQTGEFSIGSVRVEVGGTVYLTKPFVLRVSKQTATPSAEATNTLFLQAHVSNQRPFVGEQILFTLRFFQRTQLADATLQQVDFGDLVQHSLGDPKTFTKTIKGLAYQMTEIKWALFAQKPGKITIPSARIVCKVVTRQRQQQDPFDSFFQSPLDGFFGRTQTETRVISSAPVELDIQPLPSAPQGFSGLIGDFNVSASVSSAKLHVGESTTLALTIQGIGNATRIAEPHVPGLDVFKVYDDKPTIDIKTGDRGLSGQKTFRKALVPMQAGELHISPITLVYFDPTQKKYLHAVTDDIVLQVQPSTGKEELKLTEFVSPSGGKVAVQILADDILPIYRKLDAVSGNIQACLFHWLMFVGLIFPVLMFGLVAIVQRQSIQRQRNASLRRKQKAARVALKKTRSIKQAIRSGQWQTATQLALQILREFVGHKLEMEGQALTAREVADGLLRHHVTQETAQSVSEFLIQCEAAQYGAKQEEIERLGLGLCNMLETLIKKINKEVH